jgi:hypothetical protein
MTTLNTTARKIADMVASAPVGANRADNTLHGE